MQYCNQCGHNNYEENLYCPYCGIDRAKEFNLDSVLSTEEYCRNCGEKLSNNPLYCPTCGCSLVDVSPKGTENTEKLKLNQVTGVQDILSTLKSLGDSSLLIRSLYGALGAIVGGILIASIFGLIINAATTTDPVTEFLIGAEIGNPVFLFPIANGAPFYFETAASMMGHDEVMRMTLRMGSFLFLLLPFIIIFIASSYNLKFFKFDSIAERLKIALTQGVLYGVILTVLAVFMGSIMDFGFDIPLGAFAGGMPDLGIEGGSGFMFFGTLLITIFWGCLFSAAGYLYPEMKFNYSKLADYLRSPYIQGFTSAFSILKITIILALVICPLALIWVVIPEINPQSFGEWIMLPLILVQIIPMAVLLFFGAPFVVDVPYEGVYFSLWRGYGLGAEITWEWYFLLLVLIPIILCFIGGNIAQMKKEAKDKEPWKNALSFSLFLTAFAFVLVLVSQVYMHQDMGQLMQMIESMGGEQPDTGITVGFTMLRSLFSVFVFSFGFGLLGAYSAKKK